MTRPNFMQLCRLCVLKDSSFANIFEITGNLEIRVADIINELLDLDIFPGDGLPEIICCTCLNELARFKRFKNISHEAKSTLESIIKGTNEPSSKPSTSSNNNHQVEIVDLVDSDDEYNNDSDAETVAAPSPPPCQKESQNDSKVFDHGLKSEPSSSSDANSKETSLCPVVIKNSPSKTNEKNAETIKIKVFNSKNDNNSGPLTFEEHNIVMQSVSLSDDENIVEVDDMEAEIVELEAEDSYTADAEIKPGQCSRTMEFFRLLKSCQVNADNSSQSMEVEENLPQDVKKNTERSDAEENESDDDFLKCSKCSERFENGFELKNHMKRLDCRGYICKKCKKIFPSEREFHKHVKYCGNIDVFECELCIRTFSSELGLKNHQVVHSETFECDKCDRTFSTNHALFRHKSIHMSKQSFVCKKCDCTFSRKREMESHKKKCGVAKTEFSKESNMFYKCGYCKNEYQVYDTFKRHFAKHEKEGGAICVSCKKVCKSIIELKKHVSDCHGILNCGICPKKFMDAYELKRHVNTHFNEKPYNCSKCDNRFRSQNALDLHFSKVHVH